MAVRVSGLAGVALGSDYLGRKCPSDVQVGLAKVSSSTNGNRCPKGNSTQWPETCFGHTKIAVTSTILGVLTFLASLEPHNFGEWGGKPPPPGHWRN